ncbi:unnamed protein product [Nippostrongylus brasiliensis]|uniref:Peptidase A2 domain-containing protein n=1 Tax=Nippostrongylus brasiliensis TaxID=27835 RepID=A0A0N4Y6A5_NIPBR|nr:unnamed protein product [Nippostrongylus brasiliensis]
MSSTPSGVGDMITAEIGNVVERETRPDCDGVADEQSQPRASMKRQVDDDSMCGELEAEFQRLCGGEDSSGTLQVCAELGKAVKETYVRVMAEVAKHMRTSNPNRETIEKVARDSLESTLGLIESLGLRAKRAATLASWVSVVMDSLECDSKDEFVERLAEFINARESVRMIMADSSLPMQHIPDVLADAIASKELLQEQLRRQQAELEELRALCQNKSVDKAVVGPSRGSLSARLGGKSCRVIDMESREARKGETVECPLFGKKMSTELELFGRKWKGLLDTGSEISIIPAQVLLQAKSDGFDIDSDVPEFSIDDSQRVYDASGNVMHFVTVVEVKLKECGTAEREVRAKAYVTKAGDEEIILGTNVLPQLGYQLVRVAGDDKAHETRDKVAQRQFDDGRRVPTMDLLRTCPDEIRCSEVPRPKTGRRKRRCKAVQVRKGAEREFDVLDPMNCLHVEFRCQGRDARCKKA